MSSSEAVPASRYTPDHLAEIYNRARVDYIVPMPMNGKRMSEYIQHYDINLDASLVSLTNQHETGVIMLGLRDVRAWATRLGVIPNQRGHKIGQFLMESLIDNAARHGAQRIQLEVISGNDPAIRLFEKLHFEPIRDLVIIRRPPGELSANLKPAECVMSPLSRADIPDLLALREETPAWTEENRSLINTGGLEGFSISLPSGESGWLIYQYLPFQLAHFVINPAASETMTAALLYAVHQKYPLQDTKLENMPMTSPYRELFQRFGYVEAFSRIEMMLDLA